MCEQRKTGWSEARRDAMNRCKFHGGIASLVINTVLTSFGQLLASVVAELLALAATPFGAIPRALLALHYNKSKMNRLRLKYSGTLIANAIGTFIAAGVAGVSVLENPSSSWLFALSDGLAGSLSTVSTFVGEVEGEEEEGENAGYMLATMCVTSLSALAALSGFS